MSVQRMGISNLIWKPVTRPDHFNQCRSEMKTSSLLRYKPPRRVTLLLLIVINVLLLVIIYLYSLPERYRNIYCDRILKLNFPG